LQKAWFSVQPQVIYNIQQALHDIKIELAIPPSLLNE